MLVQLGITHGWVRGHQQTIKRLVHGAGSAPLVFISAINVREETDEKASHRRISPAIDFSSEAKSSKVRTVRKQRMRGEEVSD